MVTKCNLYSGAEWQSRMPQLHFNVFDLLDFIGYAFTKDLMGCTDQNCGILKKSKF